MSKWPWMAVGVALLALTGCATVQVQHERAQAIKTVALVGFTGVTELQDKNAPHNAVGDIMNAVHDTKDVFGGGLDQRRMAQAETVYQSLAQHVKAATGWQFTDRKLLANDPAYQALLKDNPNTDSLTVTGLQRLPDVLRAEPAERMDAAQRKELLEKLGVDAIAVAKVRYVIGDKSGFSIGGMGHTTIYPKAIVEFTVLDGGDKPVWRDRWCEGSPTKVGLENIMGAKQNENETQVLTAAADSAFGKLAERYQGH
jgi:hypothetical protein